MFVLVQKLLFAHSIGHPVNHAFIVWSEDFIEIFYLDFVIRHRFRLPGDAVNVCHTAEKPDQK
jgi:hypothetical protein